jgi:glycosyltransferase involved in cell wall biosynthesis
VAQLSISPPNKIRVVHIVSGLIAGGAETMLYRLLANMDSALFESEVISMTDQGQLGGKIQQLGVIVTALGMNRVPSAHKLRTLWSHLRSNPANIIQTWMYHADLIAGIVGKLSTTTPVVWNIRANVAPFSKDKKTYLFTKACAYLSASLPARIVSCSESARQSHIKAGYDASKIVTIPNGFDLNCPSTGATSLRSLRQELELENTTPLIGLITRYDRRKDLPNFAQAAALLLQKIPEVRFILCGNGINWENKELTDILRNTGIEAACFLLGRREDVTSIMIALDLVTSSSESEGFPNVLGEAMACGVPCVATDVGDSALILGEAGIIVPPKDPQALAAGWRKILTLGKPARVALGLRARRRIEEKFSLRSVVVRYETLYQELLASQSGNVR